MEVKEEVFNNGEINRTVYLDKEDMCWDCKQQYGCPLIECLANGLVIPTVLNINVAECRNFYR